MYAQDPISTPWNAQPGIWYHVAVTRDGDMFALYIDGVLTASRNYPVSLPDPAANFTIGDAEGFVFDGAVDDVRMYDRALTATEMANVACKSVPLTVQPLYDTTKAFRSGSTAPVKLRLLDANGNNVSAATLPLVVTEVVRVSTGTVSSVADSGNANPDSTFRYDTGLAGYGFNVSLKGMAAGEYQIRFTAGGGSTIYSTQLFVK
jgi:hypothetical protein